MNTSLHNLALVAALICFGLAAFGIAVAKVDLLFLGLAFWILSQIDFNRTNPPS